MIALKHSAQKMRSSRIGVSGFWVVPLVITRRSALVSLAHIWGEGLENEDV